MMRRLLSRLRYWFWSHVHDWLEQAWHWVYYAKLRPLTPELIPGTYTVFGSGEPTFEVKIIGGEIVAINITEAGSR